MTSLRFVPAVLLLAIPRLVLGATAPGADLVEALLDLPAPPRDWKQFVPANRDQQCDAPAGDAPPAALVAYWGDHHHDSAMPTAKVRERLLEIAETDLRLRGPGDLQGTQQSGMIELRIADIVKDEKILRYARDLASAIIGSDPELKNGQNDILARHLLHIDRNQQNWGLIS